MSQKYGQVTSVFFCCDRSPLIAPRGGLQWSFVSEAWRPKHRNEREGFWTPRIGRVMLSGKVAFFLLDVIMDALAKKKHVFFSRFSQRVFGGLGCWSSLLGNPYDKGLYWHALHPLRKPLLQDIVCVSTLFLSGSLQFAICQLLVLMVSMCLQVRQTRCGDIRQTLVESWKKGMASNALQRILLEEKTFEAPLSLFLQFPAKPGISSVCFCWKNRC